MKRVIAEVPEAAIVSGPGRLGSMYRAVTGKRPHAQIKSPTNVTLIEI
jgi:hypothetical protein